MAKWQLKDTTGISIGGEFYQADADGIVEVPDNVGGLGEYGFTRYFTKAELKANAEAEKAAKDAAELAALEAAELIAKAESGEATNAEAEKAE